MFLSRVFINKVLPMTKAVANYEDYPVTFYKTKSKLYRISLAPKRNNMFIRIIAAIDSWFCFQLWFCHVLLKWYCESLPLLSRLTRVTKKNCNSRRSESETESATEIVEKWVGNGFLNMGKLFLIGLEIFSMVLSNLSIFHCGVTVFGIPLAGL